MKNQKGSITIITLATILFMLAFLLSTFVVISNRRQVQAQIKKDTKRIYEEEINNIEEIYNSYFAETNATIPIYTAEQLFEVATERNIISNNKIYKTMPNANYKLISNIEFLVSDYLSQYPSEFWQISWTENGNTQTVTKWINIEDKISSGIFTGIFDYNGKIIRETDSGGNVIIHN